MMTIGTEKRMNRMFALIAGAAVAIMGGLLMLLMR